MIRHPQFPNYYIYQGSQGEKPKPNAFYAPKKGDTLLKIVLQAYGTPNWDRLMWINKNPHNLSSGVYRISQTNCNSRKATMENILLMGSYQAKNQGWLSLCPRDKNEAARQIGAPFQVIWIPGTAGDIPKKGSMGINPNLLDGGADHTIPKDPQIRTDLLGPGIPGSSVSSGGQGGQGGQGAYDEYLPEDIAEREEIKAGLGPWVVGIAIAVGVGALFWSTKK